MSAAKCLFGVAWLVTIAIVSKAWLDYEHAPGAIAGRRLRWPEESRLASDTQNGTLVMFLHPYCPCSRGGLRSLERVLSQLQRKPKCYFLFAPLPSSREEEERGENRRMAASLSRSGTMTDDGEFEAICFDAKTSGYILYYDPAGNLRFRGGVLAERGSARTNAFEHALVEAIRDPRYPVVHTPVFGCPLIGELPR